jgi:SAM-dependent methyltransferase
VGSIPITRSIPTVLTYDAPERNKAPILDVLARVLPATGTVLEIASGTGQHVVHFARELPGLRWQPSDHEAPHRESIDERVRLAGLSNVAPALDLNVLHRPWPVDSVDAIVCINMIHIAPWAAGIALLEESGRLLRKGGVLVLYGPYRRGGAHTAPSNEAFDASLRQRDARWGVRDLESVQELAGVNGLATSQIVPMPANNLSVVFRRQ